MRDRRPFEPIRQPSTFGTAAAVMNRMTMTAAVSDGLRLGVTDGG
jgi:hypothetical protein